MTTKQLSPLLAALTVAACSQNPSPQATAMTHSAFAYPTTRMTEVVEELHGVVVADPYRWLENAGSDDTKAWVDAQNNVTFSYLQTLPSRQKLQQRLTELWNYERFGLPSSRGGRYIFTKNDGLQDQSVLYVTDGLHDEARVLLDPNTLSEDGTVALREYNLSNDGKLLAYALSEGGSDWMQWRVRNVETGADTDDHLQWVKFSSVSWTKDNSGFFYSRYDAPKPGENLSGTNYFQKLYFHRLGTPQAQDKLIYERPDEKTWGFAGSVTEDGRYLIIHVWKGTGEDNLLYYMELGQDLGKLPADAEPTALIDAFSASFTFVGNQGSRFWFYTDDNAPRGRLIAIDTNKPERQHWQEIIGQSDATLESVRFIGGRFVAQYLRDAHGEAHVFSTQGERLHTVSLPELGSISGFYGRGDSAETFFSFSSFTTPSTIYRYDVQTGKESVFRAPNVAFSPDDYVTKQVFYTSKDGTKVPMFITHKKGLEPNGDTHTYLYGYGGFNIPISPYFSVSNVVWLESGGIFAVANLRGGGEYGQEWHHAGTKANKQNVFDDFIAAGTYLVENGYTNPKRLAIGGRSNGGLLVAATMLQRPDLFAAAVPAVGVLDMLRFHQFTIGWAWVDDYGSPENPEEFKALLAYSPLHNLKTGTAYPATLVTTADHDDRVVPAHSYKFTAALQKAHGGAQPVLIRIDTKAGHGAQTPISKRIEEVADVWAFVLQHTGAEWQAPPKGLSSTDF